MDRPSLEGPFRCPSPQLTCHFIQISQKKAQFFFMFLKGAKNYPKITPSTRDDVTFTNPPTPRHWFFYATFFMPPPRSSQIFMSPCFMPPQKFLCHPLLCHPLILNCLCHPFLATLNICVLKKNSKFRGVDRYFLQIFS